MSSARRLALAAAVILATGLLGSRIIDLGPIATADDDATDWLHDRAVDDATIAEVALDVTTIGNPVTLLALVVLVAGWLLFHRHRRTAWWLVTVTAAASVVESLLKVVVGRARPDFDSAFLDTVSRSFPSGHAMNTTVVLGAITMALVTAATSRRALAVPIAASVAAATALAVGLSRPVLGVHFVSDIVAGWLLGVVWLVLVRPRRDPERGGANLRPETEPASASA